MSTQKTQRQPMSDNQKRLIIIIAIVLAAVIAVSVTLGVLLKPQELIPDENNPTTNPSSNLPIKNSNFALVGSEDTVYPKSALNWTRYGYKEPSGNVHEFDPIDSTAKVVMGIVDTDDKAWANVIEDLKLEDIELTTNPKQHALSDENEKHDNSNVYMIATKTKTNAMIMSDSVSVSATTSVKIRVYVNTSQLTQGSATIMIQSSSSTPSAKEESRYAYKTGIGIQEGWQAFEFYVFNRKTSTQYIRVSVGLGNSYDGNDDAEGILYIDDISYETVTANDYRKYADDAEEDDTSYKIIEKEEETTVAKGAKYIHLHGTDTIFTNSDSYVNETKTATDAEGYSPFTDKDDFYKDGDQPTGFEIYKVSNDGKNKAPVTLQMAETIKLLLAENDDTEQDYVHVSFWVRVSAKNALAAARVYVEKKVGDDWETLSNGTIKVEETTKNIATDTNNGWTKYDIYLKPSQTETEIRIIFSLGDKRGYDEFDWAPNGDLYVTAPYYEPISNSAYTSAYSSTASKKFDLSGSTAETTVSNGSFSSISANTSYPTNWTPVFAGDNIIYQDGKDNIDYKGLSKEESAVAGSGAITYTENGYVDDDAHKVLKLVSHKASSYGMLSNSISVTAHNVYVFSVLAKVENGAKPYFYLIENDVARDKAVVAGVPNGYGEKVVDGTVFCQDDSTYEGTDWHRYYIVYVAGDKDATVKIALFNGSIDGTAAAQENHTVYYDKVTMQTLGSYTLDEDDKDETTYKVSFKAATGFDTFAECENVEELIEEIRKVSSDIQIDQPEQSEWTEMRKVPENNDDGDDDDTDKDTNTKRDVNLALLFSILSSVLLVAALAVVIVIKLFKNKKNR